MRRYRHLLSCALGPWALLAACGLPEPEPEGMPVDLRDNILQQGIIDCSPYQDTGYVNGSPFAITLVTVDGRPVERDTANAYYVMQQAAARAGVGLRIVSGFRTMAEQEYFYSCYTNCNCNNCNLAARPGYSNHQSGHALDLNTSEGGVLTWLSAHGGDYGFSRTVPSEDWHWEWWGGGPGGGPCVDGDPECLANANHGGCSGSVITHCDENNQVVSGDCGTYGATCSTLGGRPHCVHFMCWSNLNGAESGTFCVDGTQKLVTCELGAYSEGDCAAYGGTCSEQGGQAHCVHFMCWSNLEGAEDGSFCVDGTEKIGSCTLGRYEEGDCSVYGATCSELGGQPHCVHFMCAAHLGGGEDGAFCVDDSTLGSCARGVYSEALCDGARRCLGGQCLPREEIDCGDGVDEDGDGATDCADQDCAQAERCVALDVPAPATELPTAGAAAATADSPAPPRAVAPDRVELSQGFACRSAGGSAPSILALLALAAGRRRRGLRACKRK